MARGENEKACFDHIRCNLFLDRALECSYEEYCQDRIALSQRPTNSFFAMTEQDIEAVEDVFFKSAPNDNLSCFPDFVSDIGFIEHFQITSSKTTEAGAEYKKEFSKYERRFDSEVKQLQNEIRETSKIGEITSLESTFSFSEEHSHKYLIESLTQCIDKHVESEKKYTGSKTIKVFMIEYNELSIKVQIDYSNVKPEMFYGDLLRRETVTDYRLSRDKEALKYLFDNRSYIDFVVFVTDFMFEIIKVEDIPEIMKLLVFDYEFHPIKLTTMSCAMGTRFSIGSEYDGRFEKSND